LSVRAPLALAALLLVAGGGPARAIDPFAALSPADRETARAIYQAQDRGAGLRPLTLDQIATLKAIGDGWDDIVRGLKQDGLIQAQDLEAVLRDRRAAAEAPPPAAAKPAVARPAPRASPPRHRHRYGRGGDDTRVFDAFGRPLKAD
jgi:hypothetical protein